MRTRTTKPFDPAKYLTSSEAVREYAEGALGSGDPAVMADALDVIVRCPMIRKLYGSELAGWVCFCVVVFIAGPFLSVKAGQAFPVFATLIGWLSGGACVLASRWIFNFIARRM